MDYRQEYDQANKRIVRAFQGSQLIELVNLSGYEGKIPLTSRELVEILLDRVWRWPLPDQVAKTLREETEKLATSGYFLRVHIYSLHVPQVSLYRRPLYCYFS